MKERLTIVVLMASLSACSESSSSLAAPTESIAADVENVGFATSNVRGARGIVAFMADEAQQGFSDLNGDGDAFDRVLQLVDTQTGVVTNLQLATFDFHVSETTVAVLVDEVDQGGMDLSGNLNVAEEVTHLVDLASGRITNTTWPSNGRAKLVEDKFISQVPEAAVGRDLNGDNDEQDLVLFVHDASTGMNWNLELAVEAPFAVDDDYVVAPISEAAQAATDLNGDGDTDDHVVHIIDLTSFQSFNLGLAVDDNFGNEDGLNLGVGEGIVAVAVYEADQSQDLDGDGDLEDPVVHVIDIATQQAWNTGMPAYDIDYRFGAGKVLFTGAAIGAVGLRIFDVGTATLVDLQIEGFLRDVSGDQAIYALSESANQLDLNSDGDLEDAVLAFIDLESFLLTSTELAAFDAVAVDDTGFVLVVREQDQGHQDLNGDGDAVDRVFYRYDRSTRQSRRLEAEGEHMATLPGLAFGYLRPEDEDLNDDGDLDDLVLQVMQPASGAPLNLGLAGVAISRDIGQRFGEVIPFLVEEGAQGQVDLNGDGDSGDYVLHLIRPRIEPGNVEN